MEKKYFFEILIIDPNGNSEIKSEKSLLHGLLSTEKLWDEPVEEDQTIVDGNMLLRIKPVDTSSVLYNLYESAFLLKIQSDDFEKIEKFRYPFIVHLRKRLRFDHIRILTDDISTEISNTIYPMVNELEITLRRYLAKFFTQKVGLDWWKQAVPDKVIEKTKLREENENVFSKIVETDMTLIDFNDLGEIIYKHKLGFNKPENLVDKILSTSTLEELTKLKSDLDSNYNRFFKQHFKDLGFEKKWKEMFMLRNKVAHNNLFTKSDLENGKTVYKELKEIILNAEQNIDEFKFSIEEQEAMIKASTSESNVTDGSLIEIKAEEKSAFPDKLDNNYKIIDEEILIKELIRAEESLRLKNLTFVGLKSFVINILGPKGYSYGPTYAQINVLKDKGRIQLYDIDDGHSIWPVKAIKVNKSFVDN